MHLVVYSFLTYFENEGREWMMIVVCEEIETIKKLRKNYILMKYSIKLII